MAAAAFKVPTIFSAIDKFTAPLRAMTAASTSFASKTEAAAARASRAFRKISTGAGGAFDKVVNLRNAAGVLFAGMAAKKIYDTAIATAKVGDEAAKTGRVIGMTAEHLQELTYAADIQGVTGETLTKSLEKLNKNVGDMRAGTGMLTTLLNKSNPALARQLKQVTSNEEAFNLIAASINGMKNPMDKAALAQAAFGRAGMDMLKLIEAGPDGIQKLRDEAKKFGLVISNDASAAAEEFLDTQTRMNAAITGVTNTLGMALMPKMQELMLQLTAWIGNNRELLKAKVEVFVNKLVNAITWLVDNMDNIIRYTKIFLGVLVALKVISVIAGLIASLTTVIGTLGTVMTFLAANPIVLTLIAIVAAIAIMIGFVRILINHWESFGAALTFVIGLLGVFFSPVAAGFALILSLIQSFRRNWDMIVQSFKSGGILGALKAIGITLIDAVLMPLQQLLELASNIPGVGNLAASGAASIAGLREGLGTAEAVNPKKAEQDALVQRMEKTSTSNVNLNINDPKKRTSVETQGPMTGVNLSSTMAFQ